MASSSVRYAPEDRTLPKPWKGLIDGTTGYLYFWNPETNVTQYERPLPKLPENLPPPPPNPPKTALVATGSVQGKQSSASSGHGQQRDTKEDDGRYGGSRSHQQQTTRSSHSYANGSVGVGHGASNADAHGHGVHTSKSSARGHGSSDAGAGLSAEAYRRQHDITVTGDDIPAPFTTFESTGFPSEILKEVQHAGFSFPTPIQAQSWPIALQSRDVVAIAKTGSGKTLGYLLPGFIHLKRLHNNSRMGPTVLVLAPTRELATQIQEEAVKFGRSSRISCTCLYGGAPKGPQLRDLDRGADVVVATPGRLNDILEMKRISLRQVSYLVLDEADRMLDMGFEPQIRKIVKEIPARRQTLMFTATWPKEVRRIAADLLVHSIQVNIGSIDELVANTSITQYVEFMTPMEKQRRLEQILRSQEPGAKVIIFCSTKRMCDQLARNLTRSFGAAAIHGDKSQSERDYVLSQFRTGRSPILVATDVAARGLDIKDIRVVINYDFPTGVEDYVHRIGRTGRAGATGVSYTFFCDQDAKYASDLIKVLEGANQRVPSELRDMGRRGGYGKARNRWGSGSGGRSLGGGRSDSGYGGSGGWGSSGGRSDGAREARGHGERDPPRDRYDHGYYGSHDDDERGRYDNKVVVGNDNRRTGDRAGARSRSRSRSPPIRGHGSLNGTRSPNRGCSERADGRSRSRSRSRNLAHAGSRSRSRSRSHSLNRFAGGESGRGWSPVAKQSSPPNQRDGPGISLPTPDQELIQQQPQRVQVYNGDIIEPERSPSPYGGDGMQPKKSPSPYNGDGTQQWRSPVRQDGDGMRETASSDHTPRGKSRSPCKSVAEEMPAAAASPCGRDVDAKGPSDGPIYSAPTYEGGEEEEEGIIPAEEDGMIPDETYRNSPRD